MTVTAAEFAQKPEDFLRAASTGETIKILDAEGGSFELRATKSETSEPPSVQETKEIWAEILERRDKRPKVKLEELIEWRREGLRY